MKGEVWEVPVSAWMSRCSSTICCRGSSSFLELLLRLRSKTRGVFSLWRACAEAWDPGGGGGSSEDSGGDPVGQGPQKGLHTA